MKQIIDALREFSGLAEDARPTYLSRIGAFLTLNTLVFPLIPFAGSVITTHAGTLLTLLSLKDTSDDAMKAYEKELKLCIEMMEENYGYIDLVAKGDGDIVAKSGAKGTSTNTSSTGNPSTPENLKYVFVDDAGQIQITQDVDKLAYGRVIISFSDPKTTVVKSGNTQLKITGSDGNFTYVDIVTASKAIIENQTEGNRINSVVANFNPNGISPVASPKSVIIPR